MRRFTAIVASIACLAGSAAPAAAACWEAEEYAAARMRDLQTVLMVSALKCGRADPAMPGAYNAWVGRAKAKLIEGEQKLLAHFVREGDKSRYDKFTTALANRYSDYAEDSRFCERAKSLLQADEKLPGVLEELALLINSRPNGVEDVCPVKRPPQSQVLVSPFDPIPEAAQGTLATAAVAAPAGVAPPAEAAAPAAEPVPAPAPDQIAAGPSTAPAGEAVPAKPDGTVSPQRR